MPRVFTAKKNKGGSKVYKCERCGVKIKPGESYFYYTRYRARNKSIRCMSHRPRPSELTSSETLGTVYATQESLDDVCIGASDGQEIVDELQSAYDEIDNLVSTLEEKISNVESAFENGTPVLDTLNEYRDNAETYRDAIEQARDEAESLWQEFEGEKEPEEVDLNGVEDEDVTDEEKQAQEAREAWEAKREEVMDQIRNLAGDIECPF